MTRRRRRILVVSPQWPFPPRSGFTVRVFELTRQLASRHDVTVVSYVDDGWNGESVPDGVRVETVRRGATSGRRRRAVQAASLLSRQPFSSRALRSPEMELAIHRLWASGEFDAIQVESSQLLAHRLPDGAPIVLDEHNVEYELLARMREGERSAARRAFNGWERFRFQRFEQRAWRQAAACAVTSERERCIVVAHAPETPCAVVPNGVDVKAFRPSEIPCKPRTLVFNGVLDYRPNLDAAWYLVDEIWPLVTARCPEAELTIVGRGDSADLQRLARPGVVVTGEVEDVRPYLETAAVVGIPIRMGSGTRLKVLEALGTGKAVVSTSIGSEGIDVSGGSQLLLADSPDAFADSVLRLFDDRRLAAVLGRAGRTLVETHYAWDKAGERLEALYRALFD